MAGIDSYTVLNLHGDGDDQSTTIPDSGGGANCPHTVTCVNQAQIDTAQKEFGTGSILFDGTGDYLTLADSDDWDFGSGDFTIDFWVRFNDNTIKSTFYSQTVDDNNRVYFGKGADGYLYFSARLAGVTIGYYCDDAAAAFSWANNTWYHLACVRNGATTYIFINGTSRTLTEYAAFGTQSCPNLAHTLEIGRYSAGDGEVNGWIDEFRISKGVARWTENFTPYTRAYDTKSDYVARAIMISD